MDPTSHHALSALIHCQLAPAQLALWQQQQAAQRTAQLQQGMGGSPARRGQGAVEGAANAPAGALHPDWAAHIKGWPRPTWLEPGLSDDEEQQQRRQRRRQQEEDDAEGQQASSRAGDGSSTSSSADRPSSTSTLTSNAITSSSSSSSVSHRPLWTVRDVGGRMVMVRRPRPQDPASQRGYWSSPDNVQHELRHAKMACLVGME